MTSEPMFNDMFKPMLAAQYDERRIINQLPVWVQPKFDGIRVTATDMGPRTRSLKPVPNLHIRKTLEDAINSQLIPWLDGEVITYSDVTGVEMDDYNTVQSNVMSASGSPTFNFHAFDYVRPNMEFEERIEHVRHMVMQAALPWLAVSPTFRVSSLEELYTAEENFLRAGYEGMIIRSPRHGYKFGRGTAVQGELIKVKRFKDCEGVVIGFEELMHNDNEAFQNELGYTDHSSHKDNLRPGGMLGKLIVRATIDGKEVVTKLGSGFTRPERIEIWQKQSEYLGRMAKFKYFPHGTKDKPRHPIFLGWRHVWDL